MSKINTNMSLILQNDMSSKKFYSNRGTLQTNYNTSDLRIIHEYKYFILFELIILLYY